MKIRAFPLLTVCGALAASSLSVRAQTTTTTTQTTANALPVAAAPAFSGRIPEVVTLSKSGVDESVVVAFIKNSPGPFAPSADEVIRLRDAGLTSKEISAMLERGAEVRAQTAAAAPAYNYAAGPMPAAVAAPDYNAAGPMPTTAAPPVVATPPLTYTDPGYDTQPGSTVVYVGGNYGYPYYYGGYPYYYPYPYFYPGFGVGFGGFRGGFRGGFGGGFRGGFGGGFHGGGGRR